SLCVPGRRFVSRTTCDGQHHPTRGRQCIRRLETLSRWGYCLYHPGGGQTASAREKQESLQVEAVRTHDVRSKNCMDSTKAGVPVLGWGLIGASDNAHPLQLFGGADDHTE